MFSVVIADDEPLIIKGLMKMVDWEKLNTQVIGTSRNGEQLIRQIAGYYYLRHFHAPSIRNRCDQVHK